MLQLLKSRHRHCGRARCAARGHARERGQAAADCRARRVLCGAWRAAPLRPGQRGSTRVNAGQGLTPVCPGAGRVLQGLPDAAKTRLGPLLDRLQGFLAAEDTYAARLTRLTTVRILPARATSFKALLSERSCGGRGRGPKNTVLRRPAQETRDWRPPGRPVRRRHQRCGPNARGVASAVASARRD